ncbi:MAG: hypothetical protein R3A52_30390 [Polyangiales bacterium]
MLESETGVAIGVRGNQILMHGDTEDVAFVERVLAELSGSIREGNEIASNDVARALHAPRAPRGAPARDVSTRWCSSRRGTG